MPDPVSVPVPLGGDAKLEHDDWCESEFEESAKAYTGCDCANRNELRRRGFTVVGKPQRSLISGGGDTTASDALDLDALEARVTLARDEWVLAGTTAEERVQEKRLFEFALNHAVPLIWKVRDLRRELVAMTVYADAVTRGLSHVEASEEAWPSRPVAEVRASRSKLDTHIARHLDVLDHFCRTDPDLVRARLDLFPDAVTSPELAALPLPDAASRSTAPPAPDEQRRQAVIDAAREWAVTDDMLRDACVGRMQGLGDDQPHIAHVGDLADDACDALHDALRALGAPSVPEET